MTKKYGFTGITMQKYGKKLRQIRRLSDDLVGGYIEKEGSRMHNFIVHRRKGDDLNFILTINNMIMSEQRFLNKSQAIEYYKAFCSSWHRYHLIFNF